MVALERFVWKKSALPKAPKNCAPERFEPIRRTPMAFVRSIFVPAKLHLLRSANARMQSSKC